MVVEEEVRQTIQILDQLLDQVVVVVVVVLLAKMDPIILVVEEALDGTMVLAMVVLAALEFLLSSILNSKRGIKNGFTRTKSYR